MNETIVNAMGDLEEDDLFDAVKADVDAGRPSGEIVDDLQKGLDIVGDRFAEKEYFLSELIMSAELFKDCQALLGDDGDDSSKEYIGTYVMGTVATDIHDIGKNIVESVMSSNGFKVIDLGIDVPAERFVEAVKENDPQIIGFSCLLTTAFDSMKECVAAVRDAGLAEGRLLCIGGGPVDQATCEYVDGDVYCDTAQDTVEVSKKFVGIE